MSSAKLTRVSKVNDMFAHYITLPSWLKQRLELYKNHGNEWNGVLQLNNRNPNQ